MKKKCMSLERIPSGTMISELLFSRGMRRSIVNPEMTFEELYVQMNEFILEEGFINLDFLGNFGHSIVRRREDRVYIEKGNHAKLSDVDYFTFEPHISVRGSRYGYKRENIYFFDQGILKEL